LLKVLTLHPDAFGGQGGIAQQARDLLSALDLHPRVTKMVSVCRDVPDPTGPLPWKLVRQLHRPGKVAFTFEALDLALSEAFDFIVVTHINLLPVAHAAARIRGGRLPVLLFIHGIEVWEPHPLPAMRRLLGRTDHVASVSALTLDRLTRWCPLPPSRTSICPNTVDLAKFRPGPRSQALVERYGLEGRTVLLTMARLAGPERYKGVDEVLHCLSQVRAQVPNAKYLVVGDGSDRPRPEALAVALGVADSVVFSGWIPETDKVAHHRLADVFVLPGRKEGFGIVFLEAAGCGVPVVASLLDGSREAMLDGALGELVDPRDLSSVSAGILRALARPKGVRPELPRLGYDSFVERVHQLVDALI
jgi:glycosyltransferase involved in cell wall biosynthesis